MTKHRGKAEAAAVGASRAKRDGRPGPGARSGAALWPRGPAPLYTLYFQSLRMDIFLSVSFFITLATAISKSSCSSSRGPADKHAAHSNFIECQPLLLPVAPCTGAPARPAGQRPSTAAP